tara:strand:+ start:991 stop:2247 length:1257 start_codon:yes stop_codon:yes gene_type:complete
MKINIIEKNFFKNLNIYEKIILLFPFCVVAGSAITNIYLVLVSFVFIFSIFKDKNFYFGKDFYWILFYFIFILYCISISFFATDFYNSLRASVGQFRFILFSLFIVFLFKDIKKLNFLINLWFFLVLAIVFDVLFQDIFKFNIIGIPISYGGRPSSFFGHEIIAGSFIVYIFIPIIFFFTNKFIEGETKNKIKYILVYSIVFYAVILTGERLALIMLVGATLLNIVYFLRLFQIILALFFLLLFVILAYQFNEMFQNRINLMYEVLSNFYHSSWGRIYESSYMLFKENYISGVGLKNYRVDCDFQIDPRPTHSAQFCSTHPHNFFLEILSETGLIGFLIFTLFFVFVIKRLSKIINFNHKNSNLLNFARGSLVILAIYVWPIKTSGSFFSTFNGSFFWFNLGLSILIIKNFSEVKNSL